MKAVISLGGSLLTNPFTAENAKKYTDAIKKIAVKCSKLVVVVGGGKPAREYIEVAKGLNSILTTRTGSELMLPM